jgi:hypothetical protein
MRPQAISILFQLISITFKSCIGETVVLDGFNEDLTADNGIVPEPIDSGMNYRDKSMEFEQTFKDKLALAFGTSIEAVTGIWAISDDPIPWICSQGRCFLSYQ